MSLLTVQQIQDNLNRISASINTSANAAQTSANVSAGHAIDAFDYLTEINVKYQEIKLIKEQLTSDDSQVLPYIFFNPEKQFVALGPEAGETHIANISQATSGSTFLGFGSGKNAQRNTSGVWGTSSGLQNTGVGLRTLNKLTDGWFNTATGANALENLTTGKACTATGQQAMQKAVDTLDCTANGEGSLRNLITGDGNSGFGVNSGLLTGLGAEGREWFITGKINNVPRDASNFPTPANFFVESDSNTWLGTATGYKISGNNNLAAGSEAMFGTEEDIPLQGGTTTTITLHADASSVDNLYVPDTANTYNFVITEGVGGGSNIGDTYYRSIPNPAYVDEVTTPGVAPTLHGVQWDDWQANEAVLAGQYRRFTRTEPYNGINYYWLWVSKADRTTRSTNDATEKSFWTPVAIEYFIGGVYKYYQVMKPTAYNGTTKVATVTLVDDSPIHTIPDNTSKYKYTLPPYRFKTASTHRAYTAFNNVALGGKSLYSADTQDHFAAVGWQSGTNFVSGSGVIPIGAYSFNTKVDGTPVTAGNYAFGLGYQVKWYSDKTNVLGNPNEDVVSPNGIFINSEGSVKTDFGTVPTNLGTQFIKQLPLRYYSQAGASPTLGNNKRVISPYAQDVWDTLTALGYTPSQWGMVVDYSTKGNGVARKGHNPDIMQGNLILCLKDIITRLEALESP